MYYKDFYTGKVLTELEYLNEIKKRITERLEDSDEFDDFLHDEYSALDIFNFTDDDREEVRRNFEEEVQKYVRMDFEGRYRKCQGEPSNTRKICINVRETREVIRELPESNFDEDGLIDGDVLDDILREFEEVVSIYGEGEDTSTYYEA